MPECDVCSEPTPAMLARGLQPDELKQAWIDYNNRIGRHLFEDLTDAGTVRDHDLARRLWAGEDAETADGNVRTTVSWWYTMREMYPDPSARVGLAPQQVGTHDKSGRWIAPWEKDPTVVARDVAAKYATGVAD